MSLSWAGSYAGHGTRRGTRGDRMSDDEPGLVSLGEIRAAARLLAPVAVRTPLIPFPGPEPRLLVKPESLQPTGSFKLRGAYTAIMASEPAARRYGVVAHSSGNHGHAVAYAAARLGIHAVVVVPSRHRRSRPGRSSPMAPSW